MDSSVEDNMTYYAFGYWNPDECGLNILISEVKEDGTLKYLALSSKIVSKRGTGYVHGYCTLNNGQDCNKIRRYFRGLGVVMDRLNPVSKLFSQCDIFTSTVRTYTQYGVPPMDDIRIIPDTKANIIKKLTDENRKLKKIIESLTEKNVESVNVMA